MTKLQLMFLAASLLLLAACKGNPSTTSGDSTGTGAGGARVPGMATKDTTKQQPGGTSQDTTKVDSAGK